MPRKYINNMTSKARARARKQARQAREKPPYEYHRDRPAMDWQPISPKIQTNHPVKVTPQFFAALIAGNQTFIVLKDLDEYRVGDKLDFYERAVHYVPSKPLSGRSVTGLQIVTIHKGLRYGIAKGWIVVGFGRMPTITPVISDDYAGDKAEKGYKPPEMPDLEDALDLGERILAAKIEKIGQTADVSALTPTDQAVLDYWSRADSTNSLKHCYEYCKNNYGYGDKAVSGAINRLVKATGTGVPVLVEVDHGVYMVDRAALLLYIKHRRESATERAEANQQERKLRKEGKYMTAKARKMWEEMGDPRIGKFIDRWNKRHDAT